MKKKIFIIIGILLILILSIGLVLFFKSKANKEYFIGKWYYKYTYLSDGTLKYTEEDGMESYIEIYKDHTYKNADYCDDIVEKGKWKITKKGLYLEDEDLWLYKNDNNTLKTELKDGKTVLWDQDFYNVLIKK